MQPFITPVHHAVFEQIMSLEHGRCITFCFSSDGRQQFHAYLHNTQIYRFSMSNIFVDFTLTTKGRVGSNVHRQIYQSSFENYSFSCCMCRSTPARHHATQNNYSCPRCTYYGQISQHLVIKWHVQSVLLLTTLSQMHYECDSSGSLAFRGIRPHYTYMYNVHAHTFVTHTHLGGRLELCIIERKSWFCEPAFIIRQEIDDAILCYVKCIPTVECSTA